MNSGKKYLDLSRVENLGEFILQGLTRFETNVALIEADRDRETATYTFEAFKRQASQLQQELEKTISPGDHAAILMSNQSKWLFCATAIFWCGGVLVPLDYKLTPKEQLALLAHSEAKLLFIEWPVYFRMIKEGHVFPTSVRVIVTEAPAKEKIQPDHERYEHFFTAPHQTSSELAIQKRGRQDVACIVYSSGTGGTPKGCMLTHGNYLAQAEVLGNMFPIEPHDRYFSILPTNHAIDFMCGFLLPMQFGSAVVHQRTLRPEFLASTMVRYGVSHMALVPLLLKAFEKKIRSEIATQPAWKQSLVSMLRSFNRAVTSARPCYGLSKILFKPIHEAFGGKLKLMFAGGAFVEAGMAEFFYSLGLPVVIGYGLSEAGTVLTVNDLKPFRSDTVGKPIANTRLEIRNANVQGVGEVWVQGPTVMKGYFKEPELTAAAIVDGWLQTGDVGLLEPSGHVKLLGRSKNMIVTEGGKNIYPEDIESYFENMEDVAELCVFSTSYVWKGSDLLSEKLMMLVHPKETNASESTKRKILEDIQQKNHKLADFKRVGAVLFWNQDFARTASMKIKRNLLADELKAVDPKGLIDLGQE